MLAHEWAHLSGYAPESDASFVGYLAALRAGPAAEYSAWLDLVSEAANQLQPVTQRLVLEQLEAGPRRDQDAIRERLKALVQPVERMAWSTYDQMLKATPTRGLRHGIIHGNTPTDRAIDVMARLQRHRVRVLRTDEHGALVVRGRRDGGYSVTTQR